MKLICIGRNYIQHIEELKNDKPTEPVVFLKPDSAILPKKHPFYIPTFSDDIHYEVEILIKINRLGKHIAPKFAHKYYEEIGLGIDFTARDVQKVLKQKGLPWEKAKGFDGSAVIGEFVSKKSFDNLHDISFSLYKNNKQVQKGNTKNMLWHFDALIAYVSTFMTLKIGDILFTGTPAGVGKVAPDDLLVGKIEDQTFFKIKIK